jgi:aldehyde:ferredoxin oxidoreductase
MNFGWKGKRVLIDLSRGKSVVENIREDFLKSFLGGRGLNVRVLYDLVGKDLDSYSPENPLIFGTGPVTGTLFPSNGRHNVTSKSPQTGILGDSNSGGFWGPELKFAGYDQIIISGKADRPIYIWVDDDEIVLKDASKLWGKTTWETDTLIKDELGDESIQIASIGQGGERLVKYSAIINNLSRAAGRTGMGAVMGSKKLKALAVRGTKGVDIAHPELFEDICKETLEKIYNAPSYKPRSTYGTPVLISIYNTMGVLSTRNSQTGVFKEADEISGETLLEKYVKKNKACFACPVHCSRFFSLNNIYETRGEGPEFETLCALGSRCGNSNLESILYADSLANQYGIDTISTGNTISFAMECYENGLINKQDTGGIEYTWGNHEAIVETVKKIAFRDGFGDVLAEGVKRAAEKIGKGAEKYALHVKGLEPPEQGIRGLKAWGLGWAVSSRGADHLRAFPLPETTWTPEEVKETFGTEEAADRFSHIGKAELVKHFEEICALADSLEMCKITLIGLRALEPEDMTKVIYAVTGWNVDKIELLMIGERIVNLERLFNVREGIRRKDDTLPERYLKTPMPEGPSKGSIVELDPMLDQYYMLRGWNSVSGIPDSKKLKELGIHKNFEEK